MKTQLIKKYKAYIAYAEKQIADEKDPEKLSVLATSIYCYKEILRDLKELSKRMSDEELREKIEATYESNMIRPDTEALMNIAKQFANI